jgi:hypothetical protein
MAAWTGACINWDARLAFPSPAEQRPPHAATRAQGAGAIERPADYEAIASASPFLTHLSLELPTSATALPQEMAWVLSACSKLAHLAIRAYDETGGGHCLSNIVGIGALASGTQLMSLKLPGCVRLRSLAPLATMANLTSLYIGICCAVSDLAPLRSMVKLQILDMSYCISVSDLAPLAAMANLQSLNMSNCSSVSDLTPLTALVNLRSLDVRGCSSVSDLAPLEAMADLQDLYTGPFDDEEEEDG